MAPGAEQQGHVRQHADDSKRNGGDALGVQHVWIVPAFRISEDVAFLRAVTSVRDS